MLADKRLGAMTSFINDLYIYTAYNTQATLNVVDNTSPIVML